MFTDSHCHLNFPELSANLPAIQEAMAQARARGLSIEAALADNDSYTILRDMDALLVTGPTGTNVNDVCVLLCR